IALASLVKPKKRIHFTISTADVKHTTSTSTSYIASPLIPSQFGSLAIPPQYHNLIADDDNLPKLSYDSSGNITWIDRRQKQHYVEPIRDKHQHIFQEYLYW